MHKHDKILENAISNIEKASLKNRELYKHHDTSLQIPLGRRSRITNKGADILKEKIAYSSNLRFDVFNGSDSGFSSGSEFAKIIKRNGQKKNGKRIDETSEMRLSDYITKKSRHEILIDVPDNKTAKLNLLAICGDSNLSVEIIVNTGMNSKLSIFEWFGSASRLNTIVTPLHAIRIGDGSDVEINILHNENSRTDVGSLNSITLQERSKLRFNSIYIGGKATKSSTYIEASGKCSELFLNEIVSGNGNQTFDLGTFTLNSNRLTKTVLRSGAVLKEKSFCLLKGYAKIEKNAVESVSIIDENGLVMDPDARMQSLPHMSVECRDVSLASHSVGISPIDNENMFYLMTRGIDKTKAKRTLVSSFISKYLSKMENDIVKEIAISIFLGKFERNKYAYIPKTSTHNPWAAQKVQNDEA
jgi:Fe-S cluster assembly scaffold protein SufB